VTLLSLAQLADSELKNAPAPKSKKSDEPQKKADEPTQPLEPPAAERPEPTASD
jgi:hypothetical protein